MNKTVLYIGIAVVIVIILLVVFSKKAAAETTAAGGDPDLAGLGDMLKPETKCGKLCRQKTRAGKHSHKRKLVCLEACASGKDISKMVF